MDFQNYPQLLLSYSYVFQEDEKLVTSADHHAKVIDTCMYNVLIITFFSGWLLVLIFMGEEWEECNTSRELMSFLYPLMYLELIFIIGTHPTFNIYFREHII